MKHVGSIAVLFALLASACHKEGTPGSCHRQHQSACVSYDAERAAAGKRMCGGGKWIDGPSSCPTENRLGTCSREKGAVVEILYSGPPNQYTKGLAKQVCETNGGVFEGS